MNLLLLTFGERLENHYQAVFSILSFAKDKLINRIIVVTDRSEFYSFLNEKVEIINIDKSTLLQWQEPYQFFWKVKIKALELVQSKYPDDHLLYVDSDTFLAKDLTEINDKLDKGHAFMHILENKISFNSSNTFKKMFKSLNGKSFSNITINENSEMWNAGVIALSAQNAKEIIKLALATCDEMCATDCPRRLIEQFAFSISLKHLAQLNSCETIIGHYWGNKEEWNRLIADFFVNAHLKHLSVDQQISILSEYNWNQLPLEKKKRNSAEKLKKLINQIFPIKTIRYFES
ncbi:MULTISPECIES: hypothetical protein [Glaesserella]|uniref:Glycosyl transferase n=1 Tax=Glaesserella australis TaxID=2094024 RepID=A0A328BY97_9PAST|nr:MULTISPECIES: hypothetical protein [Glaesserella]AUI65353.1 hypothetical protein CJD39_01605 [Glaesserella sp. 15-184]RAL18625.1 hypothetical protein C5N92_07895 [Glaesserella australis]